MQAELDMLRAYVDATSDFEANLVPLVYGLADQIKAAATDPVAIAQLADELKAVTAPPLLRRWQQTRRVQGMIAVIPPQ